MCSVVACVRQFILYARVSSASGERIHLQRSFHEVWSIWHEYPEWKCCAVAVRPRRVRHTCVSGALGSLSLIMHTQGRRTRAFSINGSYLSQKLQVVVRIVKSIRFSWYNSSVLDPGPEQYRTFLIEFLSSPTKTCGMIFLGYWGKLRKWEKVMVKFLENIESLTLSWEKSRNSVKFSQSSAPFPILNQNCTISNHFDPEKAKNH